MTDKKDTLRLLTTLDCNLNCSYCCNNQFNFERVDNIGNIDFSKYKNLCITGGEPLLDLYTINVIMHKAEFEHLNIYLYTNGILLSTHIFDYLNQFENLKGINIGIHPPTNTHLLGKDWLKDNSLIRFKIQDVYWSLIKRYELKRYKLWTMDQCEMPNEDWILLNH